MGASNAVGTDTDPLAVRAAEANAVLNDLQDKFMVVRCGANLDDPEPVAEVDLAGLLVVGILMFALCIRKLGISVITMQH